MGVRCAGAVSGVRIGGWRTEGGVRVVCGARIGRELGVVRREVHGGGGYFGKVWTFALEESIFKVILAPKNGFKPKRREKRLEKRGEKRLALVRDKPLWLVIFEKDLRKCFGGGRIWWEWFVPIMKLLHDEAPYSGTKLGALVL
ncbi:MAG: hypothetical protein J6V53_03125 [Alphaproteobacteria bacterium]|nr:hypothetical protein [Alphaproteobacteria bacterium]